MRVFADQEICAGLLAAGQVLLDPLVLLDLALENRLGRLDAVSCQVFSLRHDADADHVVVLRDVPEPAFFGDVGHGGRAGVDAFVALRAFVIGPDGDFVQERVFDPPAVADGAKGLLAGSIQGDGRAIFRNRPALCLRRERRRRSRPPRSNSLTVVSSMTFAPFARALSSSI